MSDLKICDDLRMKLGSITIDRLEGDNLAIMACSLFESPDQEIDDDTGWTPDAVAGYEELTAAIHAHYTPTIEAQAAEIARLRKLLEMVLSESVDIECGERVMYAGTVNDVRKALGGNDGQ